MKKEGLLFLGDGNTLTVKRRKMVLAKFALNEDEDKVEEIKRKATLKLDEEEKK